jgi:hypothetical protein
MNRPVYTGVVPAVPDHVGKFAIILAPLADGAIGPAIVSGAVPCYIDVKQDGHRFADVTDGDASVLTSAARGAATILWKETATGQQWAVVALGAPAEPTGGIFAVKVSKDGGSAGSKDADCTFTYTVKDLLSYQIGTTMTPKRPRFTKVEYEEPGADSPGLAYYDQEGAIQLYEAVEERPKTDKCA